MVLPCSGETPVVLYTAQSLSPAVGVKHRANLILLFRNVLPVPQAQAGQFTACKQHLIIL